MGWFPIPFMRHVPLAAARRLGKATRIWKGFPVLYIIFIFFALPALLLGISSLFESDSVGMTALGSFIVLIVGVGILYLLFWLKFRDGSNTLVNIMEMREKKNASIRSLPDDMDYLRQ